MFDPEAVTRSLFTSSLLNRYSFLSFRGAALLLHSFFPSEFQRLERVLQVYRTRAFDICIPGGSEGPSTKLFKRIAKRQGYRSEVTLRVDHQWQAYEEDQSFLEWRTTNSDHTHKVDFWSGNVSLDFEWNSKDQTYDRDLLAIRQFYDLGAISLGIVVTRDFTPDFTRMFPSLDLYDPSAIYRQHQLQTRFRCRGQEVIQKVEKKSGKLQSLNDKMGASTTGLAKLKSRLQSGRGGGCPVLVVGITDGNII
jgi:CRISPR-associated protein Csd2